MSERDADVERLLQALSRLVDELAREKTEARRLEAEQMHTGRRHLGAWLQKHAVGAAALLTVLVTALSLVVGSIWTVTQYAETSAAQLEQQRQANIAQYVT